MKLSDLNDRSQLIFRQIVESYLETGDPVGSRTLSKSDMIAASPATVRNVMADLEDAGLIMSPHTSAGRLPTEIGLRLFVDGLLQVGDLSADEKEAIKGHCNADGKSFDAILTETTRALSGLSNCASAVLAPKEDQMVIRQIEFVPLSADQALVILVGIDGSVENRLISVPANMPVTSLIEASNFLNAHLHGQTLQQAESSIHHLLETQQKEINLLTQSVIERGVAVLSENIYGDPTLIVSGTSNLLDDASAVDDMERLKKLFDDIENKKELINLLSAAKKGAGTKIFIGSENNLFSLSGSSLVVSPYMNDKNKIIGAIGVIGPTRLNYARIIPMVDYTARLITKIL